MTQGSFTSDLDDDAGICTTCDGTGEGQYDGTRCHACKGKGFIASPDPDGDADARYDEMRERRLEDDEK